MLVTIWNIIAFQPIHNLMAYIYVLTGSIGISTVVIIVAIRLILWPMVAKQYRDTKKLRAIQPRLEELKTKYKDDQPGLVKAQQALYKEISYNPVGCFTNFLIQIPFLIAIYQSVLSFTKPDVTPQNMTELYPFVESLLKATGQAVFQTSFFGIDLLTKPMAIFDKGLLNVFTTSSIPYVVLLVLLAISNVLPTLINTKIINPRIPKIRKPGTQTDEEAIQETYTTMLNSWAMYSTPLIMTFTFAPFPSIVSVYMIAQNTISSVQQYIIKVLHDQILTRQLTTVLKSKHHIEEVKVKELTDKLLKLSPAVGFLADELGTLGEVKSLSTKIHSITFQQVLKKKKGNSIDALLAFNEMALNPNEAEDYFAKMTAK